jgi:hypothetical protein
VQAASLDTADKVFLTGITAGEEVDTATIATSVTLDPSGTFTKGLPCFFGGANRRLRTSHRGTSAAVAALRRVLMRSKADADDLVQDCVLRALSKRHLWQEGTNLRAWLFTILHNQRVNIIRR